MAPEVPDGDSHDDVKAKTIRVFSSHDAANLAAANLEAHGIHCWINADDAGGMMPNLSAPGGVRLVVETSDEAAASALLAGQTPGGEIPVQDDETGVVSRTTTPPRRKIAPVQIFLGVVAGVILCLFYQWGRQHGERTRYGYTPDGKVEEAWVYQDGRLVKFMRDRNLDGAWDHWVYYEHGRMARSQSDNNFDGKPDETWTYSNGVLVKMEKDTDFNGTPDMFCTYKYGLVQQADYRPNGAKFATQRELFRNGILVEIMRDADGEGNFRTAVEYDPFFNPISTNKLQ